ncbi:Holliday junction resolvase [Thermosipho melanesiensis]|uniref:Holliday junction resolvase YqgF n=2 Tax=Thermosipho melanesiensis TaxID=46541 RepID=A6LJS1_THEM4|nr:RuvX/YqgF family protein [Thermosipho melanesiensis]ABR30172.1 Holliday junction resolvase YqgF [Thermosipho melanesiensis BI429]APT73371.1 Holliday junction resolvase [Thermosipho melanesiensis]OOC38186.1 Holliday junction resolvase [Thermosipho melanesiensis]OOC40107.1 Holliday junction resolvase [Thermosipho melanesiensis]OOC40159.1 Holliday junction resolvase [Thermosipho melanesiensis]
MILALDYGEKKTGYAIGNEFIAKSGTIKTSELKNLLFQFKKIVLGLPLSMSGNYSTQSYKVLKFAFKLKKMGLNVFLIDERLTTKMAEVFQANDDDAFSARQIFIDYIENPSIAQEFYLEDYLETDLDYDDIFYFEVPPVKGKKGIALSKNFSIAYLHMKERNFIYRNEDTVHERFSIAVTRKSFKESVEKFLKNNGRIIVV